MRAARSSCSIRTRRGMSCRPPPRTCCPRTCPPGRAVLAANLETAINGLWDARPHVGDRITVIGAGTVGCLVAWLASRVAGCARAARRREPGARRSRARARRLVRRALRAAAGDCDLVVHASGSPDGLALALRVAAVEATVVEMSWFGDRTVPLPLGAAFHARRLSSSRRRSVALPPAQRARWDYRPAHAIGPHPAARTRARRTDLRREPLRVAAATLMTGARGLARQRAVPPHPLRTVSLTLT